MKSISACYVQLWKIHVVSCKLFFCFSFLLLLLFLLLLFFLFLSFTSKLDDQRFPEQPVSMDQLQGFLGRFSVCQRKTNTPDERSSPSWKAHGSLQLVVTLLQSDMDWHLICYRRSRSSAATRCVTPISNMWHSFSPCRVMKAWPFILPVSRR